MLTANGGLWTYSEDPASSDVDQVRFLLQDTDPTIPLLMDLEIQFLIDYWLPRYDSFAMVASKAADRVAMKFAGLVSISADGVSVNVGDVSDKYSKLAARLRAEHSDAMATGGSPDIENILLGTQQDPSIEPLNFSIGGHDNSRAGRQVANHYQGPTYSYDDNTWR